MRPTRILGYITLCVQSISMMYLYAQWKTSEQLVSEILTDIKHYIYMNNSSG